MSRPAPVASETSRPDLAVPSRRTTVAASDRVGRALAVLLTVVAVAWTVLIVAAPLALAGGNGHWPALVYEAAGLVCHQRPERSFHLAGIQLPVCARCFGFYASGTAGALLAWLVGAPRLARHLAVRTRIPLAAAALPTLLTVAGEWAGLIRPGGAVRALAALPLGLIGGWIFVVLLRAATPGPDGQMRYHF